MTDPVLCEMTDRRNPLRPDQAICVFDDRIEASEGDTLTRRIALDQVRQVRLSIEMAGQQTQVVCRVAGPSGEIVFGSRRATAPGHWADNALAFRAVLVAVHEALRPRFDAVRFVEGQSLGFRLFMSGLGAAMAVLALGFAGFMLVDGQSPMLTLAGFPFAVIGGYLAWVFRPGRPVPYDPEGLIVRFSGAADAAS